MSKSILDDSPSFKTNEENSANKNGNEEKKEVWINSIKADGGAYKGCPKNDYCQHFVDTRERPQNFIRDYEEEKRFSDYPKLNELIKRKNEVLQKRATPAMYLKCDLKNFDLSTMGKYDVILIDPPLPEYFRRVEGTGLDTNTLEPWSFEELANLRVDLLADQCCFLFLWVGSSEGLDKGRALLKKWNFRRCEDIVWIKTNKHNFNRRFVNDKDTLINHTKEHCLVGIKGAVKRGVDGHFIHANIDTDVIVSEEPQFGLTEKPQELYRIIERFCLGRKRIELFGEDHNMRPGWVTLGASLTTSNMDIDTYNSYFDGELCYPEVQGFQGGRYVGCTQEIESLRPRSPMRNHTSSIINPLSNNMGTIHTNNPALTNNVINNMNQSGYSNWKNYGGHQNQNMNYGMMYNMNQNNNHVQNHSYSNGKYNYTNGTNMNFGNLKNGFFNQINGNNYNRVNNFNSQFNDQNQTMNQNYCGNYGKMNFIDQNNQNFMKNNINYMNNNTSMKMNSGMKFNNGLMDKNLMQNNINFNMNSINKFEENPNLNNLNNYNYKQNS